MPLKIAERVGSNQINANTFKRELTEEETEKVNVDKTLVDLFPNDEAPSIPSSQGSGKIREEWRKEYTNLLVARFSREVPGSELGSPACAEVDWTKGSGTGSFSDGHVGGSAADRVSWKIG